RRLIIRKPENTSIIFFKWTIYLIKLNDLPFYINRFLHLSSGRGVKLLSPYQIPSLSEASPDIRMLNRSVTPPPLTGILPNHCFQGWTPLFLSENLEEGIKAKHSILPIGGIPHESI